jgi:hypothetical protein
MWFGLPAKVSTSPGNATNSSPLPEPNIAARVGHAVGAVLPRVVDLPWSMGITASAGRPMTLNGDVLKQNLRSGN